MYIYIYICKNGLGRLALITRLEGDDDNGGGSRGVWFGVNVNLAKFGDPSPGSLLYLP